MAGTMPRPRLHVEGQDDMHVVLHLLIRHGIDWNAAGVPAVEPHGGDAGVLGDMEATIDETVRFTSGHSVGFVLDADSPIANRWAQVHDRLDRVGIEAPDYPPPGGFIGESERWKSRVGVWLMPDNVQDGKLEDFLQTLIREGDALIGHAQSATDRAKELGAEFTEPDRDKAVVHAWLAWQKEPGRPYGMAITARFFGHDSPEALAFVGWFKRLYGLA